MVCKKGTWFLEEVLMNTMHPLSYTTEDIYKITYWSAEEI